MSEGISIESANNNENINATNNNNVVEEKRFIPSKFEKKIPLDEVYIAHQLFSCFKKKKKEQRILLMTRKSLYQLSPYDNSVISKYDYREIYLVSEISGGFSLTLLIPSYLQKKAKVEGWGTGEASWNNIKRVDFFNENPDHCFDWYIALSRLISDRWQLSFEEEIKVVVGNEVYNECFYVTKVNRHKKLQPRFLVISDQKLYNVTVSKRAIDPKSSSWSVTISELLSVTVITGSDNTYAISMQIDPTSSVVKSKSVNEISFFLLNSLQDQSLLLLALKRVYLAMTGRMLQEHTSNQLPYVK